MRIITKALLIFLITAVAYPQKTLTLDDAINIALQKNSDLKKSMNTIKSYESGVLASYGNLLPSLSASGSWSWGRTEDEGTTYNQFGFTYTSAPSVTESRNYRANVNANWTLFDGLANIAGVSQSKNNLESARLSLERLKQDIVFQTISYYYNVINTGELLKVKEDDVRQAQQNLETITERNKLGAVTLADVYAQQVTVGNAELDQIRTKNDLETAKTNLLYYLGLDVFDSYAFPDTVSIEGLDVLRNKLTEQSDSLSVLVSSAMDNRFDYKSALLNLESADDNITIARSGHFPRLTNSYGFSSEANSFNKLFASKSYSVGLTLSIPIFSGFSVSNQVEIATVNAKNQQVVVSDLEREIKRNIQKTFLDLQAAEKSLSVSEKNVQSAEENFKIQQEKYSLGSSNLLDVLTATTNYTNARVAYINSQFSYIVLTEQLKYYTGVLDYKKYERGEN